MPPAAVGNVLEDLQSAHDALARVVGRQEPSAAGSDLIGRDPPECGKQLQAALLRYNGLAARAPGAYLANAARPP